MFSRAGAIWLLLLTIAIANGALREAFITPFLGEPVGHIVSTLILSAMIFIVAWLSISWIGPETGQEALLVGTEWAVLTIAFEFLAGRYLFGASWERLIADYNLFHGRIWVAVLLANFLAPLWAFHLKQPT